MTSPPSSESQLKAVKSQLAFALCSSALQLNQREQPTALQGMPAMPAMHLRRAQPCRRRLCRRAPSRTHALSHAALPSRKSIPSRAGLASHHTRRLRHSTLSSSPPSTLVFGREISDSLLDFNTTSTTKVCASSQRHATWPTGPRSHTRRRRDLAPQPPCSRLRRLALLTPT